MMKINKISRFAALIMLVAVFFACKKPKSETTGWNYNDTKWGGVQKLEYEGQENGPGLVLIQGGNFTMGSTEQDVLYDHNNVERRVTVSSFYMDETEVTNFHYIEYLHWLNRVFVDYPEVHQKALPDTNCWRRKLAYNEPMMQYYFRHPAYRDYPVVGVSWVQATGYAAWRTDRVNEMILIREGIHQLGDLNNQTNENNFNTDAYLNNQYEGLVKNDIKDIAPGGTTRKVRMEDGIFLPDYRLPTEAEWEYAAVGNLGNTLYENVNTKKIYPWNGLTTRKGSPEKNRGEIQANFKRDAGDMAGIAGKLNDNGIFTTPVKAYWKNDLGLYNMGGNVSEWVMDVYRPLSFEDIEDLNPFRGNEFKVKQTDADGYVDEKDSLGRIIYKNVDPDPNRLNYQQAENKGYLDEEEYVERDQRYEYSVTSLVNNKARVYKGGSWDDRAYWVSPGTRRFLDENQNLATLGFRCAMTRVGNPSGNR
ncbi:SUMF1/EgtB/PvdO family nonheme iron enzyme [Oscillatoria amoena NRMC-F 0135]|nr:SUMF1/EgtB/PvdO family nonheme iron enzyme [Oscillatoria amoena NRMC-F 0135]